MQQQTSYREIATGASALAMTRLVGPGVLDGPTAKRPRIKRTVREAGPYKISFVGAVLVYDRKWNPDFDVGRGHAPTGGRASERKDAVEVSPYPTVFHIKGHL